MTDTDIKMSEKSIERQILVSDYGDGVRLWKNETGVAYRGNVSRKGDSVIITRPTMIRYGLCNGSSDLIGFKSIEITPDMVGKKVAVFTAIEVKAQKGRASDEQKRFIEMVSRNGGITGIAKSVVDVAQILEETI